MAVRDRSSLVQQFQELYKSSRDSSGEWLSHSSKRAVLQYLHLQSLFTDKIEYESPSLLKAASEVSTPYFRRFSYTQSPSSSRRSSRRYSSTTATTFSDQDASSPNSPTSPKYYRNMSTQASRQDTSDSSLPPLPALSPLPASHLTGQSVGNLLRGAMDESGKPKEAGLMLGIKLDLEAEIHLTARVRGDVVIGLY
ncbi:hypothetical protein BP5796_09477 [Coleophoma crateriformis]|uniref:Uncharacterized protein n=1 Tax=Coleophoma crateriformis TaxID=565419 RepID=A0A3D8QYH3_9HELO|nr:hypothetical protein BP5796_09477 [Coleophoma crateriformis]